MTRDTRCGKPRVLGIRTYLVKQSNYTRACGSPWLSLLPLSTKQVQVRLASDCTSGYQHIPRNVV